MPSHETDAGLPARRTLLDFMLGGGLLGLFASVVYPVLRYLKPINSGGAGEPIKLSKEEMGKLEKEHAIVIRGGFGRVLVFEDSEQKLRALDARCTHEGCTVQFNPGEGGIVCACHNGHFDLDGRVVSGPPPRPLTRHQVLKEADGSVTISPGKKGEA